MKIENYNKYTVLSNRKMELEEQLQSIDSSLREEGRKIIDIGWFQLTFGNGSNKQTILNNPNHMKEVSELIKSLINEELNETIKKMDEL